MNPNTRNKNLERSIKLTLRTIFYQQNYNIKYTKKTKLKYKTKKIKN